MVSTFGCNPSSQISNFNLRTDIYSLRAVWPAEEVAYCTCAIFDLLISLCSNYLCSCLFHVLRIKSADAFYSTPSTSTGKAFFNIQAGGGGQMPPPPVPHCAPPPTKSHSPPPPPPQEKSLFPKFIQTNQRRITNR